MNRSFFWLAGDSRFIAAATPETIHWAVDIPEMVTRTHALGSEPAVIDDRKIIYTGDEFWDLAGDYEWDCSRVGRGFLTVPA